MNLTVQLVRALFELAVKADDDDDDDGVMMGVYTYRDSSLFSKLD